MPTDLARDQPFVLCEDSRGQAAAGPSWLFRSPVEILTACDAAGVDDALARARTACKAGFWVAGWIAYEAGYAFEERLASLLDRQADQTLLWLGVFPVREAIGPSDLEAMWRTATATPEIGVLGDLVPDVMEASHAHDVARIIEHILAGDAYQINLTYPMHGWFAGAPLSLHKRLREAQRVAHGAVIHDGAGQWTLSYSPELFFSLEAGRLRARPMKGTAARSHLAANDAAGALWLRHDGKNRAENLMIVDLLRNDMARVAQAGSVRVTDLLSVESYMSVHQMTSAIEARLAPDRDAFDVLRAMFPSGSVTGAPKIRAMQLIAEIEQAPRGIYTGSIGWIGPDGGACFNVAIRTLSLDANAPDAARRACFGVGGGIVLDSEAGLEWQECAAKANFLQRPSPPYDLLETLGWDGNAFRHADAHLDRLARSAQRLGFACARDDWQQALTACAAELPARARRIRLVLARSGALAIQASPPADLPQQPVICLRPLPVPSDSLFLRHKTTHRRFYEDARQAAAKSGCFEVVFINETGHLSEGSFTTLFVEKDGVLLTPPVSDGALPGILRQTLLASGAAQEARLTALDLQAASRLYVGNAVRGLIAVRLTYDGMPDLV